MNLDEFSIGLEFWCGGKQYLCTDVGSRAVLAIRIDCATIVTKSGDEITSRTVDRAEAEAIGWFDGPPYGVAEQAFDEDDIEVCSLAPEKAELE